MLSRRQVLISLPALAECYTTATLRGGKKQSHWHLRLMLCDRAVESLIRIESAQLIIIDLFLEPLLGCFREA